MKDSCRLILKEMSGTQATKQWVDISAEAVIQFKKYFHYEKLFPAMRGKRQHLSSPARLLLCIFHGI